MNTEFSGTCGSLDERGLINGFDRKGFTYPRCGAELVANSCDANAENIVTIVDKDKIKLWDDGNGMDQTGIYDMFATFKENHINDKSMGVSGLGAKPSLYIMSKKNGNPKPVYLFTHKEGGPFIKACIPFDQIKESGRYTGMISYNNMRKSNL